MLGVVAGSKGFDFGDDAHALGAAPVVAQVLADLDVGVGAVALGFDVDASLVAGLEHDEGVAGGLVFDIHADDDGLNAVCPGVGGEVDGVIEAVVVLEIIGVLVGGVLRQELNKFFPVDGVVLGGGGDVRFGGGVGAARLVGMHGEIVKGHLDGAGLVGEGAHAEAAAGEVRGDHADGETSVEVDVAGLAVHGDGDAVGLGAALAGRNGRGQGEHAVLPLEKAVDGVGAIRGEGEGQVVALILIAPQHQPAGEGFFAGEEGQIHAEDGVGIFAVAGDVVVEGFGLSLDDVAVALVVVGRVVVEGGVDPAGGDV